MSEGSATVIYVAYATSSLTLDWLPPAAEVIVAHNDGRLDPRTLPTSVHHIYNDTNLGFGGAVNIAAEVARGDRLVLVNPDTELTLSHWTALATGVDDELVVVPLRDLDGGPTSVVNRYPTPASLAITVWRLGRLRLFRRGGALRSLASSLLGQWGAEHEALQDVEGGTWPLVTHWASGAAVSVPSDKFRAVGGFDEAYFLYFEDVDLCRRLASTFPAMTVRLADVAPGRHAVSQTSAAPADHAVVDRVFVASAQHYAAGLRGARWSICRIVLAMRARVVGRAR